MLKKYIALLEESTGADIIINDGYGFLSNTLLGSLPQLDRWHLNGYCLKIKENPSLQRKCAGLKRQFTKKILSGQGVVKSNCYCGVIEYAVPLFVNGIHIAMISLTGFDGIIKAGMSDIVCRRLNISQNRLITLKKSNLAKNENEEYIFVQLEILMRLIKEYIIKETDICNLLPISGKSGCSYVLKAIGFIEKNFGKNISAPDVARECYISTPYLQNLFKSVIGHGIAEEIFSRRIEYAKELLLTTEYSVKHISYECGFSSPDYFSTAFKRKCGITPNKYRHTKLFS